MNNILYRLEKVTKTFTHASESIEILKNIDLSIESGRSLAILGASGSGKSTLLHILGGLDMPTSGRVLFRDMDLTKISHEQKATLRREQISFVFQFHHLLPEFSTVENVSIPAILNGLDKKSARQEALRSLDLVGLENRADQSVTTLSGGECQRVAIARAIISGPKVLLADEPTGNLDVSKGRDIGELLLRLNRDLEMTLIVVTHNLDLAANMHDNYELRSGKLYAIKEL